MEDWRDVPGYAAVQVSSLGRVRTKARWVQHPATGRKRAYQRFFAAAVLKPWLTHGYWMIKAPGHVGVHRLVCLAFHGEPPEGKPNALHRNGVKTDNVPSNLYWGDQIDNAQDSINHGTFPVGSKSGHAVLDEYKVAEIRARRAAGESGKSLAEEFGISQQNVCDIVKGRTWKKSA